MGVQVECILEQDVPGVPIPMDGKSLAIAILGDLGDPGPDVAGDTDAAADIIAIDFGGGKSQPPSASPSPPGESLFAPLFRFIADVDADEWYDAAEGLAVVQSILTKLREGATVTLAPDFVWVAELGWDDDDELTGSVRSALEALEETLSASQKADVRFHLVFEL
jgi:hypothetical protein